MFRALKIIENESKNGSKITKNRVRATPHQRPKKTTLQTQKMNPKSWKTRGFFTFFWPRFGGRGNEQVRSVLFFTVFCEGERHDLSKTGGFFQIKVPPPQVNLNLSWLMPSGWSRPLHLRCGRIYVLFLLPLPRSFSKTSETAWLVSKPSYRSWLAKRGYMIHIPVANRWATVAMKELANHKFDPYQHHPHSMGLSEK